MQVMRANPGDYTAALETAMNEASVLQMTKVTELGAPTEEPMEIGAMTPNQQDKPGGAAAGRGKCHFCEKVGHWKKDCDLLKKAERFVNGNRGRGGGGRGRGRGNGRPGNPGPGGNFYGRGQARQNLLAALDAALQEEDDAEEEGQQEQEGGEENTQDF